jgi:hypothetical protein
VNYFEDVNGKRFFKENFVASEQGIMNPKA